VYLPDVDAATRMTATRTKAVVVVVERTMIGSSRPRTVIADSGTRLHEAVTDTLRGGRHRHAPASPRPMTSRPAASAPPINRKERTIRRRRRGKRRRGVSAEARATDSTLCFCTSEIPRKSADDSKTVDDVAAADVETSRCDDRALSVDKDGKHNAHRFLPPRCSPRRLQ